MRTNSSPDLERLVFPVEFKLVSGPTAEDGGTIEGYASVFGGRHESGDRVMPGAFKRTIQARIKTGMVPYLDSHQWDVAHTIGTVVDASEDSKGVPFVAKISKAPSAQDARLKAAEGHVKRNSIGFTSLREEYTAYDPDTGEPVEKDKTSGMRYPMGRDIQELKWYELSMVPLADDPNATITSVKSAVPFQDLPLGERDREWDASAARERVAKWAGGGSGAESDKDEKKMNWARYRRAFLWFDREKPDEVGSYKLPIGDVVNGELAAIPRGIFAAAAVLQGARGGAELGGDEDAVKESVERYYQKMAHEFKDESIVAPWKKKSIVLLLDDDLIGVYQESDIRTAAKRLRSVCTPELRAALFTDLSPDPATSHSPRDSDCGALDDLKVRALRSRLNVSA